MAFRRIETPNFTPKQVEEHIDTALQLADLCDLSPEDRAALLPGIFEKLSSKQIVIEEIGGMPNMVVPRGMG